jgi:uncharacterized protein (TIGR02996 family)
MNKHEDFLHAVCENPDDEMLRLLFADWLEENGEEERAEFIRLQIEIDRLPDGKNKQKIRSRETELLKKYKDEWAAPFRQFEVADSFRRFVFGVHFRQDFVWALSLNDEDHRFVDNAAALFRLAPVERVNLFHKRQHADLVRCPQLLQVKELLLDRQGFGTEEIEAFLRSPYLKNLVRLELIADDDNGHLSADGIELLSKTDTLPALRHLDLSFNWCNWDYPDQASWVRALLKGRLVEQLESLHLRSTFLEDAGTELLAKSKRMRAIRHLNLSGNSIGERGLKALATSRTLPSLVVLDLRHNTYDPVDGPEVIGCTSEIRQQLEARFGDGLLLDGELDPHPLDELFKQFK